MPDKPLEQRVNALETQVRDIMQRLQEQFSEVNGNKDWRKSLGMFDHSSLMPQIDAEGQRIRVEDRQQPADDHS